jgi:hypothetical protein
MTPGVTVYSQKMTTVKETHWGRNYLYKYNMCERIFIYFIYIGDS